jgi:hypothetical protein
MICTSEEFLLVLQNWITDSAAVVFILTVSGSDPAAPALGSQETGRVTGVDSTLPAFSFSSKEGNVIVVNLAEWSQIGYADHSAYPPGQSIKEGFTICRPGASVALWVPISE